MTSGAPPLACIPATTPSRMPFPSRTRPLSVSGSKPRTTRWAGKHPPAEVGGGFRSDVEGLRGVAVLAVLAYHAGVGGARGGFVGVDVFYVLSGFLITGLLWKELQDSGRLRLGAFYARRARRLLPAAVLVLVITLVASSLWLSPLQVPVVATDAVAAALYVANYRFAIQRTDYLADASPSPLQHYWSLGVEEQFYFIWPVLLLGVFLGAMRLRVRSPARAAAMVLALAGAGSLVLSLRLTAVSQPWAFFSPPTRAWELAAGGLVALAAPALRRLPGVAAATLGWLGLEAILWSITRLGPSTPLAAPPRGWAPLSCSAGGRCSLAVGCRMPGICGTGHCWSWPRRWPATPSVWGRTSAWPRPPGCSPWPP